MRFQMVHATAGCTKNRRKMNMTTSKIAVPVLYTTGPVPSLIASRQASGIAGIQLPLPLAASGESAAKKNAANKHNKALVTAIERAPSGMRNHARGLRARQR